MELRASNKFKLLLLGKNCFPAGSFPVFIFPSNNIKMDYNIFFCLAIYITIFHTISCNNVPSCLLPVYQDELPN